jgi:4-hydroxybenzoyl-CoA thioesterase
MSSSTGEVTLRFLAAPTDAGHGEGVGGGRVLEWIDKAAYACAANWSGTYSVTAYVGDVRFSRPIPVGDIVEAHARLAHTGRSSMHIVVTVSSGHPTQHALTPATECLVVFVAVDGAGATVAVPSFVPGTAAQGALQEAATARVGVRAEIERAMAEQRYSDAGTAPRPVLRFLAAPTDVNWGGKVHGGTVMRWIDEAAQACAAGWTRRPTVSVYAGGIHFHRPVAIGSVVEVETRILHTGPHSIHLATHVRSRPVTGGEAALTTQCMSISVRPGEDGSAAAVPSIPLVSDEDLRLDRHARDLVAMRAELEAIGDDEP